jgi:protease I
VTLASPKAAGEQVQGMNGDDPGATFPVALAVDDAPVNDFEGLLLPGGKDNTAALRKSPDRHCLHPGFCDANKPIAAICHGPLR